MIFTDSHAHLEMIAERLGPAFLDDMLRSYGEAWAAASASSASEAPRALLLDPGVEPEDLGRRLAATRYSGGAAARGEASGGEPPFLRRAAGIWPSRDALAEPAAALGRLEAAIHDAEAAKAAIAGAQAATPGFRLAAIGECGLDYHHMNAPAEAQAELFGGQIALARALGLPLIVHSRKAAAETLAILRREGGGDLAVVIHCFGYGPEEARAFLEEGHYLSFAGNLSYKGASALREALLLVPEDRLLLETDAPYMNPEPRRGRPSSPLDIERSYLLAAELRGVSPEALAQAVSRNAFRLFG